MIAAARFVNPAAIAADHPHAHSFGLPLNGWIDAGHEAEAARVESALRVLVADAGDAPLPESVSKLLERGSRTRGDVVALAKALEAELEAHRGRVARAQAEADARDAERRRTVTDAELDAAAPGAAATRRGLRELLGASYAAATGLVRADAALSARIVQLARMVPPGKRYLAGVGRARSIVETALQLAERAQLQGEPLPISELRNAERVLLEVVTESRIEPQINELAAEARRRVSATRDQIRAEVDALVRGER